MFWINFGAVLFYLMADILIWMCDVTALAKHSHSSPVYVPPREEIMEPRLWRSIMSHVTIPKVNKFECFTHHKILITECMLFKIHGGQSPSCIATKPQEIEFEEWGRTLILFWVVCSPDNLRIRVCEDGKSSAPLGVFQGFWASFSCTSAAN